MNFIAITTAIVHREGLAWNFSVEKGEDAAVRHAAALAVHVADETKVIIIATSIQMCEDLGTEIKKGFQG